MKALLITAFLLVSPNLWGNNIRGIYDMQRPPVNCPICRCPICHHPDLEGVDNINVIDVNEDTISFDLLEGETRLGTMIGDATEIPGFYITEDGVRVELNLERERPSLELSSGLEDNGGLPPVFRKR